MNIVQRLAWIKIIKGININWLIIKIYYLAIEYNSYSIVIKIIIISTIVTLIAIIIGTIKTNTIQSCIKNYIKLSIVWRIILIINRINKPKKE